MTGKLYGVGLGPEGAGVVAYPSLAGGDSFARAIAADLIAPTCREIVMDVPMTVERAPAQAAYDLGAAKIAITACAARAKMPLAARNERLTVLPGPLPADELRSRIEGAESVVIMKVGRHMAKIRGVIEDLGLTAQAMYVERATLPQEVVLPLAEAPEKAPYFSMILLAKGADPWL